MKVAVTGASGFLGKYIVKQLLSSNNDWSVRAWRRESSRIGSLQDLSGIEWLDGNLCDENATQDLVSGCDALVHAALARAGERFIGAEGELLNFAHTNIMGSLMLFEAAKAAGVKKVVFVSTCAVHDIILSDRELDEAHPLWPKSHYGAHKAAIEKFVHSYGLGGNFDICALRPTGIYGVNEPKESSKWYSLVQSIKNGSDVEVNRGGKEVHAQDVARAAKLLLEAEGTAGQSYNCYDRYISQYDVATLAKELSGSSSKIHGEVMQPKNQICTKKIKSLGMKFSGDDLLRQTVEELLSV